mmetsp:Transcript_25992/g.72795  ORF Transcript_25992/g.72795 Transcript_25992/m.72795 type:complete len:235 (+) Transcript_25992:130-834(+)|eukprot:CAMPEP_0119147240 /NCGR_PEP_ID=MMETSP1310-20130426/40065_1 /TAXON_ID=464262 /ORGANISM="Genus nov. species nov., Strain RCC2339" /LENGTH=234 /DNA_ID=CAMNT_0007139189 /DNA_START=106 /DNA_END=810 /DNA_ORIENTATION=+
MTKSVVIKIGGSFLLADGKPNAAILTDMASTIKAIVGMGYRVAVVVGGGIAARQYIAAADALGANAGTKDMMGILVSRLNARLFVQAYGDGCYDVPIENLDDLRVALQVRNVVVMGGLQPGQSTTAVAALAAEYVGAEAVIFGTDVDGVYSADPRKDPTAKLFKEISYQRLRELSTSKENTLPGQYRLMDSVALTILERSGMRANIILGTRDNYLALLEGNAVGTKICAHPKDE